MTTNEPNSDVDNNEDVESAAQQPTTATLRISVQGGSARELRAIENGTVQDYLTAAEVSTNRRQVLFLDGNPVEPTTPVELGEVGSTLIVTDKNANG